MKREAFPVNHLTRYEPKSAAKFDVRLLGVTHGLLTDRGIQGLLGMEI